VSACVERFGAIDVLVNSEAEPAHAPLATLSDDDWQAQWDLNVMAPMRLMRAAAPVMARAGRGRIVNVASAAGKRPAPQNAAYSVTKAAQLSVSRAFADTYAAQGVLVNAVAPAEDLGDRDAERPPIGRFGTPEEAAAVVLFLCSDIASVVAGAAWSADGGAVKAIV
ncbi:MAG TPA: SDR family oxidoreductase, partial [Solirubrobacteraceae bacterium]|nr:SDR family oxidoreductase [Solirubrobacteraceae bacterium]